MNITSELRVRTKLTDELMTERQGKNPGDADYDVLLTGPTRLTKLDGRPLCVYLPGVLAGALGAPEVYEILHELRVRKSRNRGLASGSPRFGTGRKSAAGNARTYTRPISSAVIGAIDPTGQQRYCRQMSWNGQHVPEWQKLHPLFREIAGHFKAHVPERYAAQMLQTKLTDPAWVIPGTPFTTITVNNSYATGTHQDKGDLDAGFSTLTCLRRGSYRGGYLVFPQYRVAVNMRHGDLLLMDAHEWHGNTPLTCICGTELDDCCPLCGAERISLVSYFRTRLVDCGTPEEERAKAEAYRARTEANSLQYAKEQQKGMK